MVKKALFTEPVDLRRDRYLRFGGFMAAPSAFLDGHRLIEATEFQSRGVLQANLGKLVSKEPTLQPANHGFESLPEHISGWASSAPHGFTGIEFGRLRARRVR